MYSLRSTITGLEMIGKQISPSGNCWYRTQTYGSYGFDFLAVLE